MSDGAHDGVETFKPIEIRPIRVFPDSGHHVKFVPLLAPTDITESQRDMLKGTELHAEKAPQNIQQRIISVCGGHPNSDRNAIESAPAWIRAWYGSQERTLKGENEDGDRFEAKIKLFGLWIAVESNLGERSRGYMTRVSDPPVRTEIEEYAAQTTVVTPYAQRDIAHLRDSETEFNVLLEGEYPDSQPFALCRFKVTWLRPDGEKPINVDLIVDFGNTRTAVLALEHLNSPSLAPICKPIPFHATDAVFEGNQDFSFDESAVLTDSWFLLRQPRFEALATETKQEVPDWHSTTETQTKGSWPFRREVPVTRLVKVTYRIPHMFVEMSPALMGPSARNELLNLNLNYGAKYFMSSPKRYAWDSDPADGPGEQNWHMVPYNSALMSRDIAAIPNLECQMLRFMVANGNNWELNDPPTNWLPQRRPVWNPVSPRYPRSNTLAWTALAIIENAFRTINSEAWRKGNREFGARQLRQILVTYPSGWTAREIEAYQAQWQKAINIFMLTRLPDPKPDSLTLLMNLDEAVASQLPIIVSEIRRLGDDGRRWFEVIGRGKGAKATARVMTIDIGGGTSDVSIVEYQDRFEGRGVALEARVLFKDSSSIAGDHLRKMLVQRVLLPLVLGNQENLDRERFEKLLAGVQTTMTGYAKWARYTRVLLLPIVNRWLADLVANSFKPFTIVDIFQTDDDGRILEDFNRDARRSVGADLLDKMQDLNLNSRLAEVQRCIRECFSQHFQALAKHVAAFCCDLVVVSGKPSELPPVHEMLKELLPIFPNRLIFARGYRAGASNWPLSPDGKVHDAKFVTVVGAALAQAIQSTLIKDWTLKVVQDPRMLTQNWWGVPMDNRLKPVILDPDQKENKVKLMVNATIARKLLPGDTAPEPVYILRWRNKEWRQGPSLALDITIKRVPSHTPGGSEALAIVRAEGTLERNGPNGVKEFVKISENDLELKLCTLPPNEQQHWLDTGRFEIDWPDGQGT